jgi:hypothetical protein
VTKVARAKAVLRKPVTAQRPLDLTVLSHVRINDSSKK